VRSRANVAEPIIGMKDTSGGSSDTEEKVPTTIAVGRPSSATPVTAVTPVG
jgi:hypothetical protein